MPVVNGRLIFTFTVTTTEPPIILAIEECEGKTRLENMQVEHGEEATEFIAPEIIPGETSGLIKDIQDKADKSELKDKAPNDSVQEIINEMSSLRGLTNSKLDMVAFNQQMAQHEAFLTMLDTAIKNAQALATKVDNANVEILNDLQDQAERWLTQAGYIQIDGATNTFSISNTSNNSQIIVDDEGIKFMDGGVMVGIITGQYLRIMRGIFAESVQIGKFKFEPFSGDDRRLFLSYLRGDN